MTGTGTHDAAAPMPSLPTEVLEWLEPHLPRLVAEVHDRLGAEAELSAVLERLMGGELEDLRARQVEHRRTLFAAIEPPDGASPSDIGQPDVTPGSPFDIRYRGISPLLAH